ncbi:MAG TPA: type II toxin-antitoxin system antitoxin SocA domain-containing protein [Terriglobales bacterium]|nr:type II toxin-antitoxin system antitoxin SocA domain-containing protein [Terriglobales bacterium]
MAFKWCNVPFGNLIYYGKSDDCHVGCLTAGGRIWPVAFSFLATAPRTESVMPSVHDVAAYILERRGRMTAIKLQKLVYYSQAWSLVWDEEPLFPERIEAWVNGPVVPDLYNAHRGQFIIDRWPRGNPDSLTAAQKDTVEMVVDFYGTKSSAWLSELTHREDPWRNARRGLEPLERGSREIALDSMAEYYGTLAASPHE